VALSKGHSLKLPAESATMTNRHTRMHRLLVI